MMDKIQVKKKHALTGALIIILLSVMVIVFGVRAINSNTVTQQEPTTLESEFVVTKDGLECVRFKSIFNKQPWGSCNWEKWNKGD